MKSCVSCRFADQGSKLTLIREEPDHPQHMRGWRGYFQKSDRVFAAMILSHGAQEELTALRRDQCEVPTIRRAALANPPEACRVMHDRLQQFRARGLLTPGPAKAPQP